MKQHLAYAKYVLMHKLYVFIGGIAVARVRGMMTGEGITLRWLWRLLVHDLSKFRPSEWRPYAAFFYGVKDEEWIARRQRYLAPAMDDGMKARARAEGQWSEEKKKRAYQFNVAWLKHLHRNDHHWQHWMLNLDSGKTVVLVPDAAIVDEMIADWIGAGTKVLKWPTLSECIAETVVWYMRNRTVIQLREVPRQRVEATLHALCSMYGLVDAAYQVKVAQQGRTSITVPR